MVTVTGSWAEPTFALPPAGTVSFAATASHDYSATRLDATGAIPSGFQIPAGEWFVTLSIVGAPSSSAYVNVVDQGGGTFDLNTVI